MSKLPLGTPKPSQPLVQADAVGCSSQHGLVLANPNEPEQPSAASYPVHVGTDSMSCVCD